MPSAGSPGNGKDGKGQKGDPPHDGSNNSPVGKATGGKDGRGMDRATPSSLAINVKRPKTTKKYVDEDSRSEKYKTDEWRMKYFKVLGCDKRYAHDWTICPFAHPGEKARRRNLADRSYAAIPCPDMKKAGFCPRAEQCEYSHNVFEYWMHPGRYRTQACNDNERCTRHACFFAHNSRELRTTTLSVANAMAERLEGMTPDSQMSPMMSVDVQLTSMLDAARSERLEQINARCLPLATDTVQEFKRVHENWSNAHPPPQLTQEQRLTIDMMPANEATQQASNLFSQLLRNGLQGGQDLAPAPTEDVHSESYQQKVMNAIKALEFTEVKHLLQLAQDQLHQEQLGQGVDSSVYVGPNPSTDLQMAMSFDGRNNRNPSLQTAPAGLESFMSHSSMLSHNSTMLDDLHQNATYPGRLMSNDITGALNGFDNPQTMPLWQKNLSCYPATTLLPPTSLDHLHPINQSLYATNSNASSHTAVQNQPFYEDRNRETHSPNVAPNHVPVLSAFQQPSSEEWKTAPGRGIQNDLNWGYSSGGMGMMSVDSQRMSVDVAGVQSQQYELKQQELNRNLQANLGGCSRSMDYEIDCLTQSFSNTTTSTVPRNGHGQNSAPLEGLYAPGWDGISMQEPRWMRN